MNPETLRCFWKHRAFGEVYAVVLDSATSDVLSGAKIDPTVMCAHQLAEFVFEDADSAVADMLQTSRDDFYEIDLPCREAAHWLTDIGAAFREREEARIEFDEADKHAKGLKKILEQKEARVMLLVGNATNPKEMPLFDKPADEHAA